MEVKKKSLSSQIYDILKMEIISQKIPFGSKIVNLNLQERFDVSSSPVRDAINRLYYDGLIESIDNKGAIVVNFDKDFYLEVNEILMGITTTAIKLSFAKSNHKEVSERLGQFIDLQTENVGNDKYYEYDYKFHKTFVEFSQNSRLKKLYNQYNALHEILLRRYHSYVLKSQKKSIEFHKRMIDSFLNDNLTECVKLNETHYKQAEIFFKNMFEQNEKFHTNIHIDE